MPGSFNGFGPLCRRLEHRQVTLMWAERMTQAPETRIA
jgi:hypothetical protein